jgi:hypothetical protein
MPERFRARLEHTSSSTIAWEPLSNSGADRTRAALTRLSEKTGPVFQTLSAADVASFVFRELAKQMPASTDSIRARVQGDRLSLRANVRVADLGGTGALSQLGSLGDHEPVEFSGTLRVVKPGLGEFQIQEAKVRGIGVPHGMISTLIRRLGRGERPAGVDSDALPLPLPPYVGDIRVANGKITLYKNVQ